MGKLAALPLAALAQVAPCQSPADLNGDGVLDAADVVTVVRESAQQPDPERHDALDLNQDGTVNLLDAMKAARAILVPGHPFPPDLDIDTPSRDLYVTANSIVPISGSISAASTLRLNGEAFAEDVTGAFQTTAFLQPGLNVLEIDASPTDGGTPARQAFSIVLDVDPPRVILAAPAPSTATPSETVTVRGTVIDETRATVRVASPAGEVDAVVDGFGEWTAQVPLLTGLNDIAIVATDEVGLANATTVRVRRFTSPAQEATSGDGARIMFPEGAFPSEDMAVALHDVTNSELDAILGFDLHSSPPPGGLGGGVIVMPSGMMLEVQGAPDNGEPLFMKDIQVSIPNTTGADNSMPIWIFQVQPDIDGDGMPQLTVISRGKVSEDGMNVVPVDEPLGPVDEILPGVMSTDNRRFDENEFDQISPARAVRELMDRIEGKAPRLRTGPNVARAKGNPLTNLEGRAPRRADAVLPALLERPAPAAPPAVGVIEAGYRGGGTLLVDNFEDGDTVNLLMPAGVTYTAFDAAYSSAGDPLRPDPLLSEHIPDEGNPARRLPEPFGVNGGVPLRGSFADGIDFAEARIITKLLAGEHPLNLAGLDNLVFKFDARSTVAGATYEVTLEDKTGPGTYIEYMPDSDWENFVFPVASFAVNVSDLQRITWRVTGEDGVSVDLQIDNPEFMWMDGTPPPPPTFVPTPTFVDPTPPPFTPTPSPTVTPIPTSTPVADPTPTPGGSSTPTPVFPTPTDSTVPTVTPESPEDDGEDEMQPKTQVTFYCCAASALIPFTGTTECDDDENVDQQRLRECISETLTSYIRCQQNVRRLLAELNGTVDEMESGYDTMFGATTINGRKVPLIVNGSLFQSVPWGLGASGAANQASSAATNLLQAGANGIADINAMDAAIASGDRNAVNAALLNGSSNSLNTVVNSMMLLGDAGGGPQLQSRTGFKAAWTLTNVAANLYKTVKGAKGYINGFFLGEPLAEAVDLEGNRCARLFNRLRDLRNCNRGSNAWQSCVEEPEDGGRAWAGLEKEGVILEGIRARGAILRERLAEVGAAANFIGEFGELNLGTMEHFVEGIDLSARFEADFDSMTDQEVLAMATAYRNKMEQAANGFLLMGNSVDGLLDAISVATEGLEVIDMSREYVADSNAALAMLDEMESVNSQGNEGAFIVLAGQHSSSAARSGPGGAFVGYKHAAVGRVGDTVTFTGGTTMANADMDTTPMSGARDVEFPTLQYEFTPFSTVEYDGFAEVGQLGMAVGADDREGDPPTVEMLFPDPGAPTISLPPGAPYLLRARATDDILTYSTRFRIDGEPTVALGSTDQPGDPQPTTFSAYFLAPEPDGMRGGIKTLVVSAEAIDSGGNIGTSGNVAINVDPDAPLLATITPEFVSTTAGGAGRQFTATVTSSGTSLPSPRWFVEGVLGGNSRFGTITQTGFYIPPADSEFFSTSFRIQVISESMPEFVGEATVFLTQPTVPSHHASVLNLLAPQWRTGFEHADPVSVLGLFVPLDRLGLADAAPVSVLGNFAPEHRTGSSEAQPVSVQNNTP